MAGIIRLPAHDGPGYPPSYYAATANSFERPPQLMGTVSCDVAIIGGGYTGLSAALHLAERGYKVALVEARQIGWGASGRNGGQIHSGQRRDQDYLEQTVGIDTAKTLWALGEEAKTLLRELIARHDIACDLADGLLHGDHKPRYVDETHAYVRKLQEVYGYPHITALSREEIRAYIETDDYHGGFLDAGGGHLHPLNLSLGLAEAARKAGAALYERTPITAIYPGDPTQLKTPSGHLTARFVLLCCNGYFDGLAPEVEAHVMPMNNFILATEPLPDKGRNILRENYAASDSRFVINYYRLSPDGRMLFGGGETYSQHFPNDIKQFVRRHMLKVFPQLRDARIDYGWGGTLAITMHRLPFFRRLHPNVLAAAGYSGQGVTIAVLGGKILAEAVDGTLSRFDLLANLPTPAFPGGKLMRWPTLVAGMTWFALRDRL